jgi:membrane protein YdbS with pleckstrin-like domain
MLKRYVSGNRLYCFSPPVMIATFTVEMAMAFYAIMRYKLNTVARLGVALLFFLALFQVSEYNVCSGSGAAATLWSRIGYVAITLLPPLGLHLVHVLAGKPRRRLVIFAYVTMVGYIVYFLAIPSAFRSYQCTGNYVIFQLGERASIMYGYYYYGWLLAAVSFAVRWLGELQHQKAPEALRRRNTIRALIVGYLVFLVPTGIANSIDPVTRRGIPSIMCGFAVLFALILTFYILPKAAKYRS